MQALTKHPEGSVRELWSISAPLILSCLTGTLMLFFDRLILANYSLSGMNAAASAGMVCAIFQFGGLAITAIAEVFVGQYNGSGQKNKLGEPVWQMIFFSFMMLVVFLPLAFWGGRYMIHPNYHAEGIPFFKWIMGFGFLLPLIAALSAFFIGQGKTKLVLIAAIAGNVLNIILDYLLVFGIKNFIPPMGTQGAAIATVISLFLQVFILGSIFLGTKNAKEHNTRNIKFQPKLLWKCLAIGFPNSCGHMIEIAAWAVLLPMMASVSQEHITALTIGQSIFILFVFVIDGTQKGVIAVASNLIGAGKTHLVKKLLKTGIRLHFVFCACAAVPLLFFPELFINSFLTEETSLIDVASLLPILKLTLVWVWLFFLMDGIMWIITGVLTAGGDTKFTMTISALSAWLFCILPSYIFVVKMQGSPVLTWKFSVLYGSMGTLFVFLRFRTGIWKRKALIENALS